MNDEDLMPVAVALLLGCLALLVVYFRLKGQG
jgi:hypothetical protein